MKLWWPIRIDYEAMESGIAIKHEDGVVTQHYLDDPYLKTVAATHLFEKKHVSGSLQTVLIPIETAQGNDSA